MKAATEIRSGYTHFVGVLVPERLADIVEDCPRGCRHTEDEPECGLDEAQARGDLDAHRLASLRRILGAVSEPAAGESR